MKNSIAVALSLISLYFYQNVLANDVVTTVKGNKVVIELDGNTAVKKGDKMRTSDGAVILIAKVKKNKAAGKIKSGTTKKGMTLQKMESSKVAKGKKSESSSDGSKKSKMQIGAMVGMGMDSMTIALSSTVSTSPAGSGFVVSGFADVPLSSSLFIRGGVGYMQFKGTDTITTTSCQGSNTCVVNINFLSLDGLAGWNLVNSTWQMYLLGGAGLMFPMSNSTNALDSASIKQSAAIKAGLGASFNMWNRRVPVEVEYNLLPPSAEVKTTIIVFRTGMTF